VKFFLVFYTVFFSFVVSLIDAKTSSSGETGIFAQENSAGNTAHFSADHVTFNTDSGTTIYAGHVKMAQGTTHIVADRVTAYKNTQGDIDQVVAIGNPAHYSTQPDDQKYPIDAFGDRIEYYPTTRITQIIGNGYVTQGSNSLKGPHIIYDMDKKIMRSLPVATQHGEKSLIILQPQAFPGKKRAD